MLEVSNKFMSQKKNGLYDMLTRQDLDEYTKSQPRGEGFDDNDSEGRYICYNCVFMNASHSEMEWCENDSCRNHDKFVERKYKKGT